MGGNAVKIIVVGGGWAGCSAAYMAAKHGAEVTLLERTDMLLGTGLVGGIVRNNGRYTAAEEMIAMGAGDIMNLIDNNCRHVGIDFPGHKHASLYDVVKTPAEIRRFMDRIGIHVVYEARVSKARMDGRRITAVLNDKGNEYVGDVFIDTTGTAGPMNNCIKYGNGCAMCILRCPSFGGRVSLTGLVGVEEIQGKKKDGSIGAMSGACKLNKESLSKDLVERLEKDGVVIVPIPEELVENHLDIKSCQQYALQEFAENIILLDTGHAKLMAPYYALKKLQKIPGFENARYEDPYAGGKGNSMRYFSMAPRDNALQVQGVDNLFCAGEKAGLLVGHTEAIATGVLAGYNSVCFGCNKPPLILSRNTTIGEAIAYVAECMETEIGMTQKYTFSGSVLFQRLLELGLYETNLDKIQSRIKKEGLDQIFAKDIA